MHCLCGVPLWVRTSCCIYKDFRTLQCGLYFLWTRVIIFQGIIMSYVGLKLASLFSFVYLWLCSISIMQSGELVWHCTSYNIRAPSYFANSMRTCLSQTQKQARHQGTIVWNNLPSELKEPMSYISFYDATYTHFMSLLWFYINFFLVCVSIVYVQLAIVFIFCIVVCIVFVCMWVSLQWGRVAVLIIVRLNYYQSINHPNIGG